MHIVDRRLKVIGFGGVTEMPAS